MALGSRPRVLKKAGVEREAINNRYHIKRPLGRGGMGAVYLVEDLKEERRSLALKCFRPRRQKPEDVDLFKHEFLLLSKLRHPNVAAVHDFGVIEGQGEYFFTTDFVDGKDLLHASEAFGWADFYEAMAQICRGLGYIHSRQLIHYDIKPTNVLIEPLESGGFIAKIIDFGLAESAHEEGLGSVRGTVSYMAPEVGRSAAIDRRADLYSLGVTFFHCATRTLPFRGSTNLDVIRAHIKRPPPDPRELRPDIPPAFARLLTRLMAKDPADRFDSAEDVIRAVGALGARTFAIETEAGAVSYIHSGRFIGREREFALLRHTFEEAFGANPADEEPGLDSSSLFPGFAALDSSSRLEEQPNLILVAGGAGSGKSRLLREFRHHVQLSRVALCEGRAEPGAPSYQPFTEAFRSLLGLWGEGPARADRLRRRLVRRHGAELSKILPELSGEALDDRPVALSPDRERLRLFDHLSRFLLEFARSRPLVVYLHDLQHADEATTAFLEYLARNLELARRRARDDGEPARLMIVASFREEGQAAIDATAERLERDGEARLVRLQNFSRGQTDELLSSMLGGEAFPSDLVSRIHAETAGNPYFVIELMRSLVEGGSLRNMGGRWALPEAADALKLPRSARDVILERLARLSEDELEPLRVLAVYGRPTTAHRFAQLIERPVDEVLSSLESLVARQILGRSQRGEEREYAFLHQLVGDALYAKVSAEERARLHRRCGDFLERSFPGLAHQNPGELVRHFLLGEDRRRALDYSVKAADAAKAMHANGRAIEFYRQALSCLDEDGPDPRRARLLEHLGLVQALTGDYAGARESFQAVLAGEPGAPSDRARLYRQLGEVDERRGDYEAALSAFSDGLRALGSEVRSQQGAKLLAATGSIYIKKGRFDLAIAFCESGLELLTGFPEEEDTAAIRTILGVAHSCKGDLSAAEREFEVSLELRRRSRHQLGIAQTLTNLGAVAMERGLTDLAVSRFEQALTLHERLGHRQGVAEAATHLGRALGHLGQAERAANLHRRALAIKERIGDLEGLVATQNDLGALMLERARYSDARRHFAEARERNRRLGEVREETRALNGEAELYLICGRIAESEAAAGEALRSATVHELLREQGRAYRSLGLVAAERSDSDRAERLLQRSLTIFARSESAGDVARVTMDLIELALEQRNGEFAQMAIARLSDDGGVPESGRLRTRFELCSAGAGGLGSELDEAIATALQAIEGARRTEDREALWRAHLVHGELREERGELEAALAAYVEAMETLRGIHDELDAPLREGFLTLARRRRLKERFRGLRAKIA